MRLAAWRREKGLTQEDLARALDCTQPYVSVIERLTDPVIPSVDVMIRIYIVTRGAVSLYDMAFPNGMPDFETPELALAAPAPLFEREDDPAPQSAALLQDAA